jgi:Tfp pilus assembly protein PilF
MRQLKFSAHPPGGDRRHSVTEADVRVVLERLPEAVWDRLAAVHFNDRGDDRRLGYVRQGRREIGLCALPPRVSLASALRESQSPTHFGAVRGCQWPSLAVRRFMLYDVFLHELGHLQVVDEHARSTRRKFARETRAQEFAEHWCRELWSKRFDHPDPVHNWPSGEEIEALRNGWSAGHGDYKKGLLFEEAERYEEAVLHFNRAVQSYAGHAMAWARLGALTYAGKGTTQSIERSIEILRTAVRLDPSLFDATIFLALALARRGDESEARGFFERAILNDPTAPIAMSMYADALADWGHFAEAEALFKRASKKDGKCVLAIRNYGLSLIRDHNPDGNENLGRAVELFERAVAVDPQDAGSHYRLGDALCCVPGEDERAIRHLKRALELRPTHAKAAERLASIDADVGGIEGC